MGPRAAQDGPREPQEIPKRVPRAAQESPQRGPRRPKTSTMALSRPKRLPRQPKRGPKLPKRASRGPGEARWRLRRGPYEGALDVISS